MRIGSEAPKRRTHSLLRRDKPWSPRRRRACAGNPPSTRPTTRTAGVPAVLLNELGDVILARTAALVALNPQHIELADQPSWEMRGGH
jgi:hypothetical protein